MKKVNLKNLRILLAALSKHKPTTVVALIENTIHQENNAVRIQNADDFSSPGMRKARELETHYPGITVPVGLTGITLLEEKFSTPPYIVDKNAPPRVNVLLPQLDPLIMFGGYIACLHFIRKTQDAGFRVRILLLESSRFDREAVSSKLASNPVLQKAIASTEIEDITQATHPLVISPSDAFIGYSFWTCIKAHRLAEVIDKKFIFFLQEYEPIFHPHDSYAAIGSYVYRLPHRALFNTELLAEYFRHNKLGVFHHNQTDDVEQNYVAFQHALTPTSPPTIEQLTRRKTRRLLFYARPEGHARRNLFEIGILGLKFAISQGIFDDSWEFHGVGTLGPEYEVDLGNGRTIKLKGTLPQGDYGAALGEFDIGLSLMLAPHPSILPFEMASAGQIVITNTYGTRTAKVLHSISSNLEPCEADPFSVAQALSKATVRVTDYHDRIQGASFPWVRDWDDTFNESVMKRISELLRA